MKKFEFESVDAEMLYAVKFCLRICSIQESPAAMATLAKGVRDCLQMEVLNTQKEIGLDGVCKFTKKKPKKKASVIPKERKCKP